MMFLKKIKFVDTGICSMDLGDSRAMSKFRYVTFRGNTPHFLAYVIYKTSIIKHDHKTWTLFNERPLKLPLAFCRPLKK